MYKVINTRSGKLQRQLHNECEVCLSGEKVAQAPAETSNICKRERERERESVGDSCTAYVAVR